MNTIQSMSNLLDSFAPKLASDSDSSNEFASVLDKQAMGEIVESDNNNLTKMDEVYEQFVMHANIVNVDVLEGATETIVLKPLDELLTEEDLIGKIITQIQAILQENLGISKEELEKKMEELGIGAQSILQLSTIQQLILSEYGANELTEALSNEQLAGALYDVTKEFEDLMGDSTMQDLIEQLDGMEKMDSNAVFSEIEETKQQLVDTSSNVEAEQTENITVSVVKDDGDMNQTKQESKEQPKNTPTTPAEHMIGQLETVTMNRTDQTILKETVSVREIVSQLVEKIHVNLSKEVTTMNIQLNPEHLGSVQVEVSSKSGVLTAQLTVQRHTTKEAMESSIDMLKISFENQGLKVEEVEVVIGEYSSNPEGESSQGNQQGQANKKQKTLEEIDAIMSKDDEGLIGTNETSAASIIANGMDISA